jgi:hypothetical protein
MKGLTCRQQPLVSQQRIVRGDALSKPRQSGRTIVVNLGHSQSFATESEAQRWRAAFASALAADEPPLAPWHAPSR